MLLIAAPRPFPCQLDRITVYSSRFMFRAMSYTDGTVPPGRAPRRVRPAEVPFGHSLVSRLG